MPLQALHHHSQALLAVFGVQARPVSAACMLRVEFKMCLLCCKQTGAAFSVR